MGPSCVGPPWVRLPWVGLPWVGRLWVRPFGSCSVGLFARGSLAFASRKRQWACSILLFGVGTAAVPRAALEVNQEILRLIALFLLASQSSMEEGFSLARRCPFLGLPRFGILPCPKGMWALGLHPKKFRSWDCTSCGW